MKRICVEGPCCGWVSGDFGEDDCHCQEYDNADPDVVGYPPFHEGCMCIVKETAEGRDVLFIDGPKAGQTIRVPGTGMELPQLQCARPHRSHNEVGKGIRYLLSRRRDGQWIGTLDRESS